MQSRITATRALACRRAFSTAKNNSIKRCIPVTTQSKSLYTAFHLTHRSPIIFRAPKCSHIRYYSASSEVEEDPERKGLYYHPVGNNVFALSFLDDEPPKRNSATVIGFVQGGEDSNSFQENQAFIDLLHDTIKAALIEGVDQELGNDAVQRKEGWLHVHGKCATRAPSQSQD
ncbi:unnamed protein product [Rhizoctonia solani]|uniref:Uncharacterized protein n=1 Tax=Rhizoctonia solani TaxID=456999 RepID=A0A8H3DP94_9AGAM|nr:unnamed protein product [Rhizoctonia solani]